MLFKKKKTKSLSAVVQLGCRLVRVEGAKADRLGFTVLEMIVVASIIVILMVVFLANFRGFESKAALENEAEKLISVLKQAQIFSLTGQTIASTRYNYGIHLEECESGSCTYVLFSDLNSDNDYDAGEIYNSNSFTLLKGVYISSLSPDSGSKLDIIFEAPLGDIYFNNSQSNESGTIILSQTISDSFKTITINRISGRIDVQ